MSAIEAPQSTIFDLIRKTYPKEEKSNLKTFLNESDNIMFRDEIRPMYYWAEQGYKETGDPYYLHFKLYYAQEALKLREKEANKKVIGKMCDDFAHNTNEYYSNL